MNKVCEDIKAFLIQREREEKFGVKTHYLTDETEKPELVLFANKLSEKYGEHVDVKLVKSLIVNIQDSIEKDETNGI